MFGFAVVHISQRSARPLFEQRVYQVNCTSICLVLGRGSYGAHTTTDFVFEGANATRPSGILVIRGWCNRGRGGPCVNSPGRRCCCNGMLRYLVRYIKVSIGDMVWAYNRAPQFIENDSSRNLLDTCLSTLIFRDVVFIYLQG